MTVPVVGRCLDCDGRVLVTQHGECGICGSSAVEIVGAVAALRKALDASAEQVEESA